MSITASFTSLSSATLQRLQEDPTSLKEYLNPDDGDSEPPNYFDLDKAWHGIHYLLTGEAYGGTEPESLAVFGGQEFGPDLGYGPASFLTAEQVSRVADALLKLTPQALAERFNPEDMETKDIYPDIWVRDGEEALEDLLESYQELQIFYRDAASRGEAVIVWFS